MWSINQSLDHSINQSINQSTVNRQNAISFIFVCFCLVVCWFVIVRVRSGPRHQYQLQFRELRRIWLLILRRSHHGLVDVRRIPYANWSDSDERRGQCSNAGIRHNDHHVSAECTVERKENTIALNSSLKNGINFIMDFFLLLLNYAQLGTKHMAPLGGATSKRLDRPKTV